MHDAKRVMPYQIVRHTIYVILCLNHFLTSVFFYRHFMVGFSFGHLMVLCTAGAIFPFNSISKAAAISHASKFHGMILLQSTNLLDIVLYLFLEDVCNLPMSFFIESRKKRI